MKTSSVGIALLEAYEGLSLKAYQDSGGVWTIGYGHTTGVTPGMAVTKAQALDLLATDLATAENAVNRTKVKLSQNQFDALVSFTFNTGVGTYGNKIQPLIEAGKLEAATAKMKQYVYDRAGNRLNGLVNRRTAEILLFETPVTASWLIGAGVLLVIILIWILLID